VCQSITDLAVEKNAPISTDDFRTLNRCLDDAIAGAVTQFGREQNQSTLDGETARGSERAGFLAHELRNVLNTAIMAFEVLKTGNVGVVSRRETSTNYSARSNSAAPIGLVSALASPSADGASKRTTAGSMRVTCPTRDASSPLTSRGSQFPPSRWCSFGAHARSTAAVRAARCPYHLNAL
jgi:hypothetical protein